MFSFLHIDHGMTLVDVPDSMRQLCTLKLKISKIKRKGGVVPLELVFATFSIAWRLTMDGDQNAMFPLLDVEDFEGVGGKVKALAINSS